MFSAVPGLNFSFYSLNFVKCSLIGFGNGSSALFLNFVLYFGDLRPVFSKFGKKKGHELDKKRKQPKTCRVVSTRSQRTSCSGFSLHFGEQVQRSAFMNDFVPKNWPFTLGNVLCSNFCLEMN